MPGAPLGTPDSPAARRGHRLGPLGLLRRRAPAGRRRTSSVQVDMYDRLPTPFGLVRGGVAPDHQKIKSVTRVYDKIAAHPEFRFFGNVEMGRDITHDGPVGLLPRDHLRGGRAHRPAHGDPARAPARQPLGHRVRGLVQRPPRLPQPRFDLHGHERGGGRQRQRGDGRGAASSRARARRWRRPTSPTTPCEPWSSNGIREIHVLGRRGPGPGRLHQQGAQGARRDAGRRRDRRPGRDRARPASSQADVDAQPRHAPATATWRSCASYAEREPTGAPDADRPALPGLAGGDPRHRARRGAHDRPQRALRERGRQRCGPAPPTAAPRSRSGWSSGRSATRACRCPGMPFDAMRGVIPNEAGRIVEPDHRRAGRWASTWSAGSSAAPRGSSGPTSPTPRRRVDSLLGRLAGGPPRQARSPRARCSSGCSASAGATSSRTRTGSSSTCWSRSAGRAGGRPRVKFSQVEEMLHALKERKRAAAEEAARRARRRLHAARRPCCAAPAMRPAPRIAASSSSGVASWPCAAPEAREMFSSMRVPPKSLHPASSRRAPPSRPSFTHEAWMLSISPSSAIRPTAWTRTTSSQVGPGRDLPWR